MTKREDQIYRILDHSIEKHGYSWIEYQAELEGYFEDMLDLTGDVLGLILAEINDTSSDTVRDIYQIIAIKRLQTAQ